MRIEILNPKALQLIKGMQALNRIKISKMPAAKLKAHNQKTKLKEPVENEELMWRALSSGNFLKRYSENEPEYSGADIKEPNPVYKT